MKRIIALLILTVLCFGVLTSCEAVDTVKGWFGIGGEEESTGLAEADVYLHKLYSGKDGSKVSNSFDVVGKVPGAGKFLEVTWTADNEKVEIVPSTTAGYYTVKLPANNTEEFTFSITATITDANGDTKTRTYSFTMIVVNNDVIVTEPQEGVDYKFFLYQGKYQQNLYMLNTTQDGGNKFINTSNDPKVAAVFNVEKVEGGYKFYTMINNVKNYIYAYTTQNGEKISKFIGYSTTNSTVFYYDTEVGGAWMTKINDYPYGVGTYDTFKTVSLSDGSFFTPAEVGNSQYVMKIVTAEYANSQTPDEEPTVEVPEANTTLTIPEAIQLGGKVVDYTEGKYYISGSIVNITSDTYGNMNIQDAEGNKILVYGTYDKTGANRFDAMNPQPAVGDTIVVYGVIGNHKGTPQMKDGWIQSINGVELEGSTPGGETPETPSTTIGVVAAPVAGTAYKFGMVQTNAGKTVYLVGGMDGYYMATTEDVAAAIDVYLEETEGGYYLYTLDGETKTYINMVVSGEHVNGAYEATASTVYTYDATNKTIIANVTPEGGTAADYWFGTRSDKSYTTVGPCAVSYAGFYCQFYGEVEGGEDVGGGEGGEGETPVDPETPSTPSAVTTIPDALAAADGTAAVINGIVISTEAWNTQYNNMSVTIKDAEGNTLYIFRLATQVGLGDDITVTGTVGSYNDAKQIAAGATAVINTVHGDNHTYENGKCTVCESLEPVAGTKVQKCDFSTVSGTQYANETNTFGDVKVSTYNEGCHFNQQLRIYASDKNNGYAVVETPGAISTLVVNAGYKAATLEVYGSTDGETWVKIQDVTTTSAYANHTVNIDASLGYKYLKLDATGAQIRVASIDITYAA